MERHSRQLSKRGNHRGSAEQGICLGDHELGVDQRAGGHLWQCSQQWLHHIAAVKLCGRSPVPGRRLRYPGDSHRRFAAATHRADAHRHQRRANSVGVRWTCEGIAPPGSARCVRLRVSNHCPQYSAAHNLPRHKNCHGISRSIEHPRDRNRNRRAANGNLEGACLPHGVKGVGGMVVAGGRYIAGPTIEGAFFCYRRRAADN